MQGRLLRAVVGAALDGGVGMGIALHLKIPSITGVAIATAAVGAFLGFVFRITSPV